MYQNNDKKVINRITYAGRFTRDTKVKIKSNDIFNDETGVVISEENADTTSNTVIVDDPKVELEHRIPVPFDDGELDPLN